MNSRTWQRLGSHFTTLNLVWTCEDALWKSIHNSFLPRFLHLCGHIRYVLVFRHACSLWTARKLIDLVDHLAQKSGDSNGPEIVATAAFLKQNTFGRKLLHTLACITVSWIVGILSRRRERREKCVDGHCGKEIGGAESDYCKRWRCFTPSWYERCA